MSVNNWTASPGIRSDLEKGSMVRDRLAKMLTEMGIENTEFIDAFLAELTTLEVPKHQMILSGGQVSDSVYYLEEGFAMTYSESDGNKRIDVFWQGGDIMLSPDSFLEQRVSFEYIQAMDDCKLVALSYTSFKRLIYEYEEASFLLIKIVSRYSRNLLGRIHDVRRLDASQHLDRLQKIYPHLEQLVPQDMIASYLGITPQSLSRVKRQKRDA